MIRGLLLFRFFVGASSAHAQVQLEDPQDLVLRKLQHFGKSVDSVMTGDRVTAYTADSIRGGTFYYHYEIGFDSSQRVNRMVASTTGVELGTFLQVIQNPDDKPTHTGSFNGVHAAAYRKPKHQSLLTYHEATQRFTMQTVPADVVLEWPLEVK